VVEFVLPLLAAVRVFFSTRRDTALEALALRQQLAVLKRKRPRPPLHSFDRLFWINLRRLWPRWADLLVIVKPETVIAWHRAVFVCTGVGGLDRMAGGLPSRRKSGGLARLAAAAAGRSGFARLSLGPVTLTGTVPSWWAVLRRRPNAL